MVTSIRTNDIYYSELEINVIFFYHPRYIQTSNKGAARSILALNLVKTKKTSGNRYFVISDVEIEFLAHFTPLQP